MKKQIIALVDCNNFYASCERVFNPVLEGHPVIVASNNDGCVVARSQEVKDLGIKMGLPLHKIKDLIKQHNIAVYSSNYALYGDMSERVMFILGEFAPAIAVYSIDEAFLNLTGIEDIDLETYGKLIKKKVLQYTGIPTCVGIGPTKTLAKAANWGAKHYPESSGVVDLTDPRRQEKLLRLMKVSNIWGVGRKLKRKLINLGIHTGWDLRCADEFEIRNRFNVTLQRTVKELKGTACLPFEEDVAHNKQIIASRSFGKKVSDFPTLQSAITHHASRAACKLRKQNCVAGKITVSIITNPFSRRDPQYYNSLTVSLPGHTNDTFLLVETAVSALKSIYRPGFLYKKAGVMLNGIKKSEMCPLDLFDYKKLLSFSEAGSTLMAAIDKVNTRFGRNTIVLGGEGFTKRWRTKAEKLSNRYTTRWEEIPVVR